MAAAFQRGLVFLLLPVYTHVLNPADYGRLSILLAIAAAANIVLSFGIDTAFFRTYFALREDAGAPGAVRHDRLGLPARRPAGGGGRCSALLAAPFLLHSEWRPRRSSRSRSRARRCSSPPPSSRWRCCAPRSGCATT